MARPEPAARDKSPKRTKASTQRSVRAGSPRPGSPKRDAVGREYHLHTKNVALRGTDERPIYYFSHTPPATPVQIPDDMERFVSKTGLPMLRKKP